MSKLRFYGTVLGLLVVLLLVPCARASFPCGIFARVDKVILDESHGDKPEWIKIQGKFIIVMDSGRRARPREGWLYFSLVKEKAEHCWIEWNDLKSIANTKNRYVAFGSTYSPKFKQYVPIHKNPGKDAKPVQYPLDHGIHRLRTVNLQDRQLDSPVTELKPGG